MFIDNKYTQLYYKIIEKAKSKNYDVFEKHHIIPKSLGGSNKKDNLVKLSLKEHFICHRLLVKMTKEKHQEKMIKALYLMSKKQGNTFSSSAVYEKLKVEFYRSCRGPKKWTVAGKQRLSELAKQRIGQRNGFYGKSHSKETNEKNRKAHLGKKLTKTQKEKISGECSSRFKGYYYTPWGVFPSSSLAEKSHPYLKAATIHRWCLNSNVKIFRLGRSKYLQHIGSTCIEKTYKELGFWFEPKQPFAYE